MTQFITKRQNCLECKNGFVRLVNDEYCSKCYQSRYYQTITKAKRKKRKKETSFLNKKAWWVDAYNKR